MTKLPFHETVKALFGDYLAKSVYTDKDDILYVEGNFEETRNFFLERFEGHGEVLDWREDNMYDREIYTALGKIYPETEKTVYMYDLSANNRQIVTYRQVTLKGHVWSIVQQGKLVTKETLHKRVGILRTRSSRRVRGEVTAKILGIV